MPEKNLKSKEKFGGKRFALIGAAGYIAPKHMRAIKDIGGRISKKQNYSTITKANESDR